MLSNNLELIVNRNSDTYHGFMDDAVAGDGPHPSLAKIDANERHCVFPISSRLDNISAYAYN
jgi:hypothetical protein